MNFLLQLDSLPLSSYPAVSYLAVDFFFLPLYYSSMLCLVLSTPDNWLIFAALQAAAMNWTAMDMTMGPHVHQTISVTRAELGLFLLGSFAGHAPPVRCGAASRTPWTTRSCCWLDVWRRVRWGCRSSRRHLYSAWRRPVCCSV